MAGIEPYSACPCGSGQKFKWCCHKVESYADRSQRLFDGGQVEAAIQTLDEGLRKEKDNAWLLTRKAFLLIRQGRPVEAKQALLKVLESQPKHFGALVLSTRLIAETEGPKQGCAQLQKALAILPEADHPPLESLARLLGSFLVEMGDYPAALKHLRLGEALEKRGGPSGGSAGRMIRAILTDSTISRFMKNEEKLSKLPKEAIGPAPERFSDALIKAEGGLWAAAAEIFESLETDREVGTLATRNLGFCRLWLADDHEAVAALRRYAGTLGATTEAVEIEALCQQLFPDSAEDAVEQVQLSWPLRDRDALLRNLTADPRVSSEGKAPVDEDDPDTPELDLFLLLDRPDPYRDRALTDDGAGLAIEEIPRCLGRVFVGLDSVLLETYDDGRLDALVDQFTAMARPAIPPAHPRTKVLGKTYRRQLAMAWEFKLPDGITGENLYRLMAEQGKRVMWDLWPTLPCGPLNDRSPLQAAAAGDSEVPLRAAVFQFECMDQPWSNEFDFEGLRKRLKLAPEPEIDPETLDPKTIHAARLDDIPVERLSDEKLAAIFLRANQVQARQVLKRAAIALTERPGVIRAQGLLNISVHGALAAVVAREGDFEGAMEWLRRGRQADPPDYRALLAVQWDLIELRFRAQFETPEHWVPELAAILDRHRSNEEASATIVTTLIEMGLIEVTPNPSKSGEPLMDPRPLQALMDRYGPRVTTASGRLGVSATNPEIWTPAAAAAEGGVGSSGIWTPGGTKDRESEGGGGGKKLIVTGF